MKPLYLFFFLACTNFVFAQGRPVNQKAPKPPLGKIKGFTYFEDSTNGFYLKNMEVTIGEYFEFVDWVIDSCARRILADEFPEEFLLPPYLAIGLDGELIEQQGNLNNEKKFKWDDNEYYEFLIDEIILPTNQRFYRNPTFNSGKIIYQHKWLITPVIPSKFNYYIDFEVKNNNFRESLKKNTINKPINNISYKQAQAYCEWKTQQLNKKSKNKQYHCFIPEAKHINKALNTSYQYCQNWLQVYPDELEQKKEVINSKIIDSLNEQIYFLKNNTTYSEALINGTYRKYQFLDTVNPELNQFNRKYKSTNDYYAYDDKKNLSGLNDNVSEWINYDLPKNDSTLKTQLIQYRGQSIFLGDFYYATMVIGGNWWHGKDNFAKTYINKETQLETIGFRYVIEVKEK